jgi:hypothetical protein
MLQVSLSPDAEKALRERASASGEDVGSYAARLLKQALSSPSADELLAPFRKQVEESDLTDGQLDQLGEELQREVRQESAAQKSKTA